MTKCTCAWMGSCQVGFIENRLLESFDGPNSFVDSDEVSPEIGLQNAESFYGSAGRSSSRICHISMLHVMEYNVACVLIFNRNE